MFNNLEKIQLNTFNGLSSLKDLDLSYNNITFLESGAFSYLKELITLDLQSNNLNEIVTDPFYG